MAERLVIERLGQRGDGVAATAHGPVYVPYALPGETVLAEVEGERGRLVAVEAPSPDRVAAPCPLFTICGGCAVQHLAPAAYDGWKAGQVATALRQAGLEAPVHPLVHAHGAGRRRVTFHARRIEAEGRSRIAVGFMAARSHALVPIAACPLLVPELAGAPEAALALAEACSRSAKPLDIQVTATLGGLDVDLRGHGPAAPKLRSELVLLAERLDLARLTMHGELIVARRPAAVRIGPADVELPPGGFLQATLAGEDALAALVLEALPKGAKRVADLFAGVGPFALRLAGRAAVHAVEGDAPAAQALAAAVRRTQALKPLTAETRDLFRRPLVPPELNGFDMVVFDPPRAGAEAQARQLAASTVPVVVAVSCNPATFARDAALLVGGGYALAGVTPVDQFRYAAHVELVGVFHRPRASRARRTLG